MFAVLALAFLVGLCVGSFLNVVIIRTAGGESWGGRSHCRSCKAQLTIVDLVPVASFLALKGKCRHCGEAVSPQYPLVEFATGLLFLLVVLKWPVADWIMGWGFHAIPEPALLRTAILETIRDFAFVSVLVVLFVYDLRYYLILDRFTVPAMIFAFVANAYLGVPIASLLLGAAVGGGFFLLQYVISRGTWIGGGDIRMGVLMGLMLGFEKTLLALFVAYALGAVVGIFLLLTKRADLKTQVPFGTFLAASTLLMIAAGEPLIAAVERFLTL
jgi:prepilin signal peptidase PulO-like enzyme (type II secretory pathway)